MQHYYQEIQGWFLSERFYAAAVARVPDGGTLVEVGCWRGRSLSCLLVEAVNSGKLLNIIGVDHWQGSVGEPDLIRAAKEHDLYADCEEACRRADYPFELIRCASVVGAVKFRDASLDFVFLDASHDERSVAADIDAWLPKVKSGGVLAGHDAEYPSVMRAVRSRRIEIEVWNGCWLTVK